MTNRSIGAHLAGTLAALLFTAGSAMSQGTAPDNTLTEQEKADGWRLLFDGKTLNGWRAYGADTMPSGWQAVNGILTRVSRAADIITKEQFGDFDLVLDWKVGPGGNSGIFYRAVEGLEWIYHGAPEYQLLDDPNHRDGRNPLTSAGAAYGLYEVPRGIVKPAGEWNTARIMARGAHVQHWLNGQKTADYMQGSPEWAAIVATTKFNAWPAYGKAMRGHIGLQEHGGRIEFRNIKIRELK
jgi:hypothetical protein